MLQTGDEKLLSLATECKWCKVPSIALADVTEVKVVVVVVFTKYDMLFNEHYRKALKAKIPRSELRAVSEKHAAADLDKRIVDFGLSMQWVNVSTDKKYPRLFHFFIEVLTSRNIML